MHSIDSWKSTGQKFRFRNHEIFYRYSPNGDKAVLCLHGFPTSSYDYNKIWDQLAQRLGVLTFDMIGYGFSDKPYDFPYTTNDQVDLLEALVKKVGLKRVHILAHDYGNTITQELLARGHERGIGFEIGSICFLNGALFPETHRPILAQKILISPIGAVFGRLIPLSMFRKSLASVFGPETQPSDSELNDYIQLFDNKGGRRISHKLIRYMRERAENRERWVGALEHMNPPFRFINGLADPVSGAHLVKRFRELLPDQKDIVELQGIGHFPHLEKPGEVLERYLEFHYANID